MSIWKTESNLEVLNRMGKNTMIETLGIEFTELNDDSLVATMPVDSRTHQPMGLLHGGASAALAETLGSVAGVLAAGEGKVVVGVEINANHLKSASSGVVTGTARPLRVGRSIQVWDIQIVNEQQELCCVSRLTVAVRSLPGS